MAPVISATRDCEVRVVKTEMWVRGEVVVEVKFLMLNVYHGLWGDPNLKNSKIGNLYFF